MSQDYKKRTSKHKNEGKKTFFVFLTGLSLGLGGFLFLFFNQQFNLRALFEDDKDSATKPLAEHIEPTKPHFEFYDKLPKMTLEVSPIEQTDQKLTTTKPTKFFLQIAAFRDAKDAESLKARLAFLGLQANISSIDAQNTLWHRVQLGPFNDKKDMGEMEELLKGHGFSGLLIRQES